jgi:hypothetical protein
VHVAGCLRHAADAVLRYVTRDAILRLLAMGRIPRLARTVRDEREHAEPCALRGVHDAAQPPPPRIDGVEPQRVVVLVVLAGVCFGPLLAGLGVRAQRLQLGERGAEEEADSRGDVFAVVGRSVFLLF